MPVFDDAVFLWNPGDSVTASFDIVTSTSASGITEGSIVTESGQNGRFYAGAVGSRFASPIANLKTTSWTMMCVTRSIENGVARSFNFANSADSDQWAGIWAARNDANRLLNFRLNGSSSIGAADWPAVTPASQDTGAFYVNVMVYTRTDDSNGTLTAYVDSSTAIGSDTLASASACAPDRLTVGRLEDSSPTNSGSGEVYAAAVWERAISEAEIDEILADPFAYLSGDITGTGTSTLGDVTSDGDGTFIPPAITGTGSPTLEDVESAGSGTFTPQAITGTGASTLDDVSSAGDGTFIAAITGTGSSTLEDVTSTGQGFLGVNGAGASTLEDVTSDGSGLFAEAITGTGSSTLGDVTSEGTGNTFAAGAIGDVVCGSESPLASCGSIGPGAVCNSVGPLVSCRIE